MTPLLQRLSRSDRRMMIVSPADAAEAFTAIADQVLDSQAPAGTDAGRVDRPRRRARRRRGGQVRRATGPYRG
ncbi:hypothetical protein ACWD8I_03600 [Micromonospora arida]|uniref:hypothetical protein n=1 Tax=Micromonospora arida TaxID=2203715 RepID=UPI0033FD7DCD